MSSDEREAFPETVQFLRENAVELGIVTEREVLRLLRREVQAVMEDASMPVDVRSAQIVLLAEQRLGRHPQVTKGEPSDAIRIPRPIVPYGPAGMTEDESTAHYLEEVVRKIDTGFLNVGGSNVTAAVRKLLLDAAAAVADQDNPRVTDEMIKTAATAVALEEGSVSAPRGGRAWRFAEAALEAALGGGE